METGLLLIKELNEQIALFNDLASRAHLVVKVTMRVRRGALISILPHLYTQKSEILREIMFSP